VEHSQPRLTKREKRIARQNGNASDGISFKTQNFNLRHVNPLTENQRIAFDAFDAGKHLMLHGMAGTGKTFIALYKAIEALMENKGVQNKIYVVRSVVPTRDMGFLPGNQKEKMKVYEAPYYAICTELFDRSDAYEVLKQKNAVEFISTSFVRGITMNNCFVIVDEVNNMTFHELDSVITRIGKGCRVLFCGDFRQSDLTKDQEKNGLKDFMRVIDRLNDFVHVDFLEQDIVRSRLVKEYIIARQKLGLQP
jgi:phosphate starvation-inducible protein PhoH